MTTGMSDSETWAADWMRLAKLCQQMAASWPEYVRLAAMPSTVLDGFGSGGSGEGRSKGTHSDSPAAIVLRREGVRDDDPERRVAPDEWLEPEVDRVRTLVARLYGESVTMVALAGRIEGLKRLIDNRGDSRYGRQSSITDCLCCEAQVTGIGEDRIKAGYCPSCHRAWLRYREAELAAGRDPVQEMFRRTRRIELAPQTEEAS